VKVLCVNDLPPGGTSGAEVHLELLMAGLERAGDEVRLFTRPPHQGVARLADAWDPGARRALDEDVRRWQPDVLHFHNVVRELSVAVLSAAPDVPRVLTVHDGRLLGDADGQGALLRAWQRGLRAPLDRSVARRRSGVTISVSGPLSKRLQAAGFRQVRHIAPWTRAPMTAPVSAASSTDLVFVGRLDPDKGVDVLLHAFAQLDDLDARLLIAGAGSLEADVQRAAAQSAGRVIALGRLDRPEVSRLLAGARAVVLPSRPGLRPEGAPLALIEGLMHGRPLVVSDDPGAMEVAHADGDDEPAGLVTRAGDVADLARALRRLLTDDALATRLSAAAQLHAASHGEDQGIPQVRDCYRLAGAA
jgi:glycosyltransferase involved in cell wall biosynthesis